MISSLVIHLDLDERLADEAIAAIAAEPSIEVGDRHESRLPIVLECVTPTESQEVSDWLPIRIPEFDELLLPYLFVLAQDY